MCMQTGPAIALLKQVNKTKKPQVLNPPTTAPRHRHPHIQLLEGSTLGEEGQRWERWFGDRGLAEIVCDYRKGGSGV